MKHIILILLSLTLGLANPVFALEAGDRHADPFKVMTKGQVIGQVQSGSSESLVSWFLLHIRVSFTDVEYKEDGSTLVFYSSQKLISSKVI